MLPYIEIRPFELGPLTIHPFGMILAVGIGTGWQLCHVYQRRMGMDKPTMTSLLWRVVIFGFLAAHLVDVLLYRQGRPLFAVWEGISSFGGILGGVLALALFRHSDPTFSRRRWADLIAFGFAPGFWLGRIGCAIAHDHIGKATNFPLAVDFPAGRYMAAPDGGPHHDLGLYEALLLMPAICLTLLLLSQRKSRRDGRLAAVAAVFYSIPRFFLEFLRLEASDPRYFGLTPAQYFSVVFCGVGCYLLVSRSSVPSDA